MGVGLSALTSISHASPPMAGITAACFVLAGLAVWASAAVDPDRHGRRLNLAVRRFKNACAGIILLVGGLKILEFASRMAIGYRPACVRYSVRQPSSGGNGARNCIWLRFSRFRPRAVHIAWLRSAISGPEPVDDTDRLARPQSLSYLEVSRSFPIRKWRLTPRLLFILLSAGILCLRTDGGLTGLMVSDTPGGMIARRLLPAALFVPIGLRWLRMMGQLAGWYGSQAGWSLFTLANALVFGGTYLGYGGAAP